jgi:hypothetical protein
MKIGLICFCPHVKDIKGGYFGVGSIQNFTLASWADSEYIWLMDFTRVVVATNKIHAAFLKNTNTPAEHRALWERKNEKKAYEIIEKEIKDDDLKFIKQSYRKASPYLMISFKTIDKLTKKRNYTTWLQDQKYFDRLKNLAMNNRIRALRGDLNGNITVKGIAEAATKMNVPMRILYYSNAEEYFGRQFGGYKESFRKNFGLMPVDDTGFTVRTISFSKSKFVWADDSHLSTDRGFHYTLMSAKSFVNALNAPGKLNVTDFYKKAELDKTHRGLSFIRAEALTPAPQTK